MVGCGCGRNFLELPALLDHQIAKGHFYCQQCCKKFVNEDALRQHKSAGRSFRCDECEVTFCSKKKLESHQISSQHCYCAICNRLFIAAEALKQHIAALHTNMCSTCGKNFRIAEFLRQHQIATEHRYCSQCKIFFSDQQSLEQHKRLGSHLVSQGVQNQKKKSSGATPEFHCCDCDRDFVNEQALTQHCDMKIHNTETRQCPKCKRIFQSQKSLQQHLASLAHKPLSDIKCVASSDCKGRFSSPSGLVQHLESGMCCSGMTRKKLNELVQSNDVDRVISAGPQKKGLISSAPQDSDSDSDSDSNDGVPIYTPISSGSLTPGLRPTVYDMLNTLLSENTSSDSLLSGLLTPRSSIDFSDQSLIPTVSSLFCPLCPPTRKAFINIEALEMHLASPKHAPKSFHCPTNLFLPPYSVGKKKNHTAALFSTLSGLTQHLESGACKGGKAGLKAAMKLLEQRLMDIGFQHQGLLKI